MASALGIDNEDFSEMETEILYKVNSGLNSAILVKAEVNLIRKPVVRSISSGTTVALGYKDVDIVFTMDYFRDDSTYCTVNQVDFVQVSLNTDQTCTCSLPVDHFDSITSTKATLAVTNNYSFQTLETTDISNLVHHTNMPIKLIRSPFFSSRGQADLVWNPSRIFTA